VDFTAIRWTSTGGAALREDGVRQQRAAEDYLHAYQAFGEPELARVARDVLRWMEEWLSDRERGGFYCVAGRGLFLDDDGDYFTWTLDEAAEVLTAQELAVAAGYYEIGEIGDMHHNVRKKRAACEARDGCGARKAGVELLEARTLLDAARQKMLAARWPGRLRIGQDDVCCVECDVHLGDPGGGTCSGCGGGSRVCAEVAGRALGTAWGGRESGLAHVMAYGEPGVTAERVAGVLDDYVFLGPRGARRVGGDR